MEFIIEEPDKKIGQEIKANWDRLAKPLDGLGEFEGLLARIGAILGSPEIDIAKKAVIVMCADNGVVAEGISQSGQEITAAVTENLGKRNTSVCKMAKAVGAEIFPVDIGVNTDRIFSGVISRKVKKGTNDFLLKPAMSEREAMQAVRVGMELVKECKEHNMGFIAMKGLAGGLINQSKPAMAFMTQFDNVIPIWGIQREKELDEWLSFMDETPRMDDEITAYIEKEKQELVGDFCRGCGYCMPCPAGIMINQCARMSLMLRRAPSKEWLTPQMQEEMKKIENCKHCGACIKKCPYELDTPALLEKNYDDYKKVLAGEVEV